MGEHVGIIRDEEKLKDGIEKLKKLLKKSEQAGTTGGRKYNPGWHQVIDLKNMIKSGILLATAALAR